MGHSSLSATCAASIHWGSELDNSDFRSLEARWITPQLGEQMQLRRVTSDEGAEILGRKRASGRYEGILIPNIAPGESFVRGYRIRRDRPDIEHKSDGTHKEKGKYLSPPGQRNMLYFVPGTDPAWLKDETLPIVLTEGEFKAAALFRLARQGLLATIRGHGSSRARCPACGTGVERSERSPGRRANATT
jgi:hypothetical protein